MTGVSFCAITSSGLRHLWMFKLLNFASTLVLDLVLIMLDTISLFILLVLRHRWLLRCLHDISKIKRICNRRTPMEKMRITQAKKLKIKNALWITPAVFLKRGR